MLIIPFLTAYLIGSIPFGVLLARAKGINLREVGSGNIGATNVLRTGHKGLAALTLLLDGLKGYAAVRFAYDIALHYNLPVMDTALLAAFAAVLGHVFPVWLKFKGGKGVATALGATLFAFPVLGLKMLGLWLIVFGASRISSLSALSAFGGGIVIAFLVEKNSIMGVYITLMFLLICITHRANIGRLLNGTEPRFGGK